MSLPVRVKLPIDPLAILPVLALRRRLNFGGPPLSTGSALGGLPVAGGVFEVADLALLLLVLTDELFW